jgi:hypothetical protein
VDACLYVCVCIHVFQFKSIQIAPCTKANSTLHKNIYYILYIYYIAVPNLLSMISMASTVHFKNSTMYIRRSRFLKVDNWYENLSCGSNP